MLNLLLLEPNHICNGFTSRKMQAVICPGRKPQCLDWNGGKLSKIRRRLISQTVTEACLITHQKPVVISFIVQVLLKIHIISLPFAVLKLIIEFITLKVNRVLYSMVCFR